MTDRTKSFARRTASREGVDIETSDCFHLHREESAPADGFAWIVFLHGAATKYRSDYCSSATNGAVCVCVCVRERAHARVCVCVCVAKFFFTHFEALSLRTRSFICDLTYDVAYCGSLCTRMQPTRIFSARHID